MVARLDLTDPFSTGQLPPDSEMIKDTLRRDGRGRRAQEGRLADLDHERAQRDEVSSALLSRLRVWRLEPLTDEVVGCAFAASRASTVTAQAAVPGTASSQS